MELGISAGAGTEADPRTRRAASPRQADVLQRAVTERILALADQAGYGAALIDAVAQGSGEASVITWPQFARMVRAAARGLSRRGLRDADTAGIFVQDAASHVVAVHAVRTAGAIALPVRPARAAADVAAQLKRGRARLLITSAGLAELAIQAAERSLVRQVFAFGEAEGTTPFGSLLHTARHGQLNGNTSHKGSSDHNGNGGGDAAARVLGPDGLGPDGLGPDGLGPDGLGPDGLSAEGLNGLKLDGPTPELSRRDVIVAAPPCGDPDVYTSLLDLALVSGATIVAVPLPQVTAAVGVYKGTAAIVPRGTDVPGLPAERVFAAD